MKTDAQKAPQRQITRGMLPDRRERGNGTTAFMSTVAGPNRAPVRTCTA